MDNERMCADTQHARTHTRTHTHKHTALLGSIKPHLINVLINLDSVIYLRGEKKGDTSSHAISLIAPSESKMPACSSGLRKSQNVKEVPSRQKGCS